MGIAIRRQAMELQPFGDHLLEGAFIVEIAGDGRRLRGALEQAAQAGAGAQLARLQDEKGGRRGFRQKLGQRLGQPVAGLAQPEDAPAAGQRQGRGLVGQPDGILLQLRRRQLGDAEGVPDIAGQAGDELDRPFAHQPLIGAIEEDGGDAGLGRSQEAPEIPRRDLHQGVVGAGCGVSHLRLGQICGEPVGDVVGQALGAPPLGVVGRHDGGIGVVQQIIGGGVARLAVEDDDARGVAPVQVEIGIEGEIDARRRLVGVDQRLGAALAQRSR